MAKFCFILSRSPYSGENIETLYHLASAALKKKHNVTIFLSYDGVYAPMKNLRSPQDEENPRDWVCDLIQKGADIICNGLDARMRGIDGSKSFLDGVKIGGLSDLSEVIAKADRLITL